MNSVLRNMQGLGCRSHVKVAVAYHVYMELCEVLALWDVQYHYAADLNLIYFSAKRSRDGADTDIFVPHSSCSDLDLRWLEVVQNRLCPEGGPKRVTLAIKQQDSSVVYYSLSQGLIPPDSPETARRQRRLQENRHKVEAEVHRQQKELLERATRQRNQCPAAAVPTGSLL